MVTYFNRKDLLEFGRFLLSDERTNQINALYKDGDPCTKEERLKEVYHNEVENWLYEKSKRV